MTAAKSRRRKAAIKKVEPVTSGFGEGIVAAFPPIVETVLPEVAVENVDRGESPYDAPRRHVSDEWPDVDEPAPGVDLSVLIAGGVVDLDDGEFDLDDSPAGPRSVDDMTVHPFGEFDAKVEVEGVATRADSDPLTLLEDGETILAERREDEVLYIVTSSGRKVGIGPDGSWSVLIGPDFATAPASEPEAEPEYPAGDVDA